VRAGLVRRQAGDQTDRLCTELAAGFAPAREARDLRKAGPAEVRDGLGADRDGAGLDAAMGLFEGLGAAQVRWWPVVDAMRVRGGVVAEGLGDAGFQLRLVVLDDEEIMAATIADGATELALREDRIAGGAGRCKRPQPVWDDNRSEVDSIGQSPVWR